MGTSADLFARKGGEGKRCANCDKVLSDPGQVFASGMFSGDELDAAFEKIWSRPVHCEECDTLYCEECTFREGKKRDKRRLICPVCHSDLGDASRL
jgi:hypothetical protein